MTGEGRAKGWAGNMERTSQSPLGADHSARRRTGARSYNSLSSQKDRYVCSYATARGFGAVGCCRRRGGEGRWRSRAR
jgi:hypothetical protein